MADTSKACSVSEQLATIDQNSKTRTDIQESTKSVASEQCAEQSNGENAKLNGNEDESHATENMTQNEETTKTGSPGSTINQYKDFSGVDTESFITTTLRNHPKDRALLLSLEKFFQEFIQDDQQTVHQFQAMNSYERMIVHRVAAFFGLNHNIDKNGHSVMISKTANTRLPELSFRTFIPADELINGASIDLTLPMEATATATATTRRMPRRSEKNTPAQMFIPGKGSESRERSNRSQQGRSSLHHQHTQQRNVQASSHLNGRSQVPVYSSPSTSYYPTQLASNPSSMPNYVPMVHPGSSQFSHGLPTAPIFFRHSPHGPIQYLYPSPAVPHVLPSSSERQYAPIYPSNFVSPVMDQTRQSYSPSPYVHLYPTAMNNQYVYSPSNMKSIQYATNQFAALNLQSPYDHSRFLPANHPMNYLGRSLMQSTSNGSSRMLVPQLIRPANPREKSVTPSEEELKAAGNHRSTNAESTGDVGASHPTHRLIDQ